MWFLVGLGCLRLYLLDFVDRRSHRRVLQTDLLRNSAEVTHAHIVKHILGAAILGTGGDEVIHVLLDVMYAKAPYTVIQRAMHIHPTVAEYFPTVLSKLEPVA